MPGIVYGCITPHPPVMLSQIGKGREAEVSASIEAMEQVCRELAQQKVDSALIVSPHGTVFSDAMGILTAPYCQGSMLQWGASGIDYRFENDLELVTALQDQAGDAGISLNSIGHSGYDLDHGVMVPAYFLIDVLKTRPLVPLSFSMLPLETHLEFGRAVGRAALLTGKRVAFIASGDLSHRLLPEAPAGFDPLGQVFDQEVTKAVSSLDSQVIMNMDRELVTRAGECGLRSIVVLLGALEGRGVTPKVLSYEGPFGVGYLTASFVVAEKADETEEHPLVQLARETVEQYVHTYTVKEPSVELSEEMRQQAGVFVSIKRAGHLRGCVGTARPTRANVAEEVIANAINSATRDTRFPPVMADELPELEYSVDVLTPLEPVGGLEQLDPETYGLVVKGGDRTGVLLPGLEQVTTPEGQLEICRSKAGIAPEEPVEMFRFTVRRYGSKG